jgi:hypothetical protein
MVTMQEAMKSFRLALGSSVSRPRLSNVAAKNRLVLGMVSSTVAFPLTGTLKALKHPELNFVFEAIFRIFQFIFIHFLCSNKQVGLDLRSLYFFQHQFFDLGHGWTRFSGNVRRQLGCAMSRKLLGKQPTPGPTKSSQAS